MRQYKNLKIWRKRFHSILDCSTPRNDSNLPSSVLQWSIDCIMNAKLNLTKPILSSAMAEKLLIAADKMLEEPFSFGVEISGYGAAVLTTGNAIYGGKNRFSPSHNLTLHAEQVALAHCFAHGDPLISAIAVSSTDRSIEPVPCGICLQLLFENARYSGCDIHIITKARSYNLTELYPFPWPNRPPVKS